MTTQGVRNIDLNKAHKEIYILLAFLVFFVLLLLPNILGLFYPSTNWNVMGDDIRFVGLGNYRNIFSDSSMWKAFQNTGFYAVLTSILKGAVGLVLVLALNREIRSRNLLRTLFFLPTILPNLAVGLVFQQVFHPDTGILNEGLRMIGLPGPAHGWLIEPDIVMWSCVAIEVWKAAGFNMVTLLTGLRLIPQDMYEAYEMDGANSWQKFLNIMIPSIIPSITINMLLNVISGLKVFDVVFALTNGGPGRPSEVVNITILNQFSVGNYGYGTAFNTVVLLALSIISIVVIWFYTSREEVEQDEAEKENF